MVNGRSVVFSDGSMFFFLFSLSSRNLSAMGLARVFFFFNMIHGGFPGYHSSNSKSWSFNSIFLRHCLCMLCLLRLEESGRKLYVM